MAQMWPKKLPADVLSNTLRSTECKVYRRLENVLEDPFVVFYSRPWLGLSPDGAEIDGECDFVVAHPDLGLLTIEVKGGSIAYNPKINRWTSIDRWGLAHNIKNPVDQAKVSKHQILSKLKLSKAWKPRRIRARHGIIFPDSEKPDDDLGADMPLNLFCFSDQFDTDLRAWVLDRYDSIHGLNWNEKPLGLDGIIALESILAQQFQLHVPLGKILLEDDSEINILTLKQYQILKIIKDIKKAAISGGAGTGKTVLAMEEAKRSAESGMRVLFTCYNRPLADDVRRRLKPHDKLIIATFHELCYKFASYAGITIPSGVPFNYLFNSIYPDILIKSIAIKPDLRFNTIIVDEGQDFQPSWWNALNFTLVPKDESRLRIFYDSNQRLYGNAASTINIANSVPILLNQNLRNTKRIHKVAQNYYAGIEIEAIGPEGVDVEWIIIDKIVDINKTISDYIKWLITSEKVNPSDITILAASENVIRELALNGKIGDYQFQTCDKYIENTITLDTVRRFKGLESQIVIIAATPEMIHDDELLYVALSRARILLAIVGDRSTIQQIKNP